MRKRKKRIVAGTMVAIMMAGSILCNISPLRASETGGNVTVNEKFNKEGLWITEIYQNDVDRSEKNNSRETSGYESIRLYKSTTDLMEFVEITSTYDKPVNFNDTYEFVYNDTALQVSTMDGSSDVVIQPEEKVVLWNYRSDIKTPIPTEAEFREEMRIPDDVVVIGMENGENFQRIRGQQYLFGGLKVLFVSRYPQSTDLRTWLQMIPNRYIHFGDFDLAGIEIYQREFYVFLRERSEFFIPADVEERLKNGNRRLYDVQYARYKFMDIMDERLLPLVEMIHRYGKGYEQEGYIIG